MKIEEKIKAIADHYGPEVQLMKLIEECAELTAAASKWQVYEAMMDKDHPEEYCRPKQESAEHEIRKELADVLVVARQMLYFMEQRDPALKDSFDEIRYHMKAKCDRQLKRIEEEKSYAN